MQGDETMGPGPLPARTQGVDYGVSSHENLARVDSFLNKVRSMTLGDCVVPSSLLGDADPIPLFGPWILEVARANSSFNMMYRDIMFSTHYGPSEGRSGVALDYNSGMCIFWGVRKKPLA